MKACWLSGLARERWCSRSSCLCLAQSGVVPRLTCERQQCAAGHQDNPKITLEEGASIPANIK